MSTIDTTADGAGVLHPATPLPKNREGVQFIGGQYVVREQANWWDVSGAEHDATPTPIVTVYDGAGLVMPLSFFGLHWHNFPNTDPTGIKYCTDGTAATDEDLIFGAVRSHDYSPNSNGSVRWSKMEGTVKGSILWDNFDRFCDYWNEQGKLMHFNIGFCPQWASSVAGASDTVYSSDSDRASNPPDNVADVADFATAVATRAAGRIAEWAYYNEPNATARWWNGTVGQFAQGLRAVRNAVRAIMPTAYFWAPEMAGISSSSLSWANAMWAASDGVGGNGRDHTDGVSFHTYMSPTTRLTAAQQIDSLRAQMVTSSVVATDVAYSEGGATSPEPGDDVTDGSRTLNLMVAHMILYAAKGLKRFYYYDVDGTRFGFVRLFGRNGRAVWNDTVRALMNGEITRVNQLPDGRVAYIRNGKRMIAGAHLRRA